MPTPQDIDTFHDQGFLVRRGLFSPEETAGLREHYTELRQSGTYPLDDAGIDTKAGDPLLRWPRLIKPHTWDARSRDWLLDPRLRDTVGALLGDEPVAVQSMVYCKPPGSRGQALHQDQYFLRARPGTCMAAWLALDDTDDANGCIRVVPGSQDWPILCPVPADTTVSFARDAIPLPDHVESMPVEMAAGDVLFFNGSLVHGSAPNVTADRFRRSLIGHYIEARARSVVEWDQPVLRMDGTEVCIDADEEGGPCGVWAGDRIEVTGDLGSSELLKVH